MLELNYINIISSIPFQKMGKLVGMSITIYGKLITIAYEYEQ